MLLLPDIARLYGVLVDDLFRESARGYENLAARLLAVFERTGKHEDFWNAYQEYERLFALGCPTADDHRRYGVLHEYMMGLCREKALALYDRAMELSEGADRELFYRVTRQKISLRCRVGEGGTCVEEQKRRVTERPEDPEEWACLLHACLAAGQLDEGARAFERAAARFPEDALVCLYDGDILRQRRRYEEAFRSWEKSWALDHSCMDALYAIALLREELGQYGEAQETWERITGCLMERGLSEEAALPREMAERCRKMR